MRDAPLKPSNLYRDGGSFATPRETIIPSLEPFFIDSATIGPTPCPELTKQALQSLFWGRGYDVKIDDSKIPFRDWL
jgi:hypothetical protein